MSTKRNENETNARDEYQAGFGDGLRAAADLARAGCSGDDLSLLLPVDPARMDPDGYQTRLGELRRILHTDLFLSEVAP
ncbi:MAG: hypothetical protein M1376_11380 [Planctomycetes bacterium]|nr:hypothetical protein [Planctomycetota bacterium]